MKVVRDPKDEPMWDTVGISSCDFRPHYNGDLVNLYSFIVPEQTIEKTQVILSKYAREIARWVILRHKEFSSGDRFQIVLGWPKSVRKTGRQIVKTGGDLETLIKIVDETIPVIPRPGWTLDIFDEGSTEQCV